ncbi:MAG: hypothetical protein ABIL11_13215 [Chloroflexota bacterium]
MCPHPAAHSQDASIPALDVANIEQQFGDDAVAQSIFLAQRVERQGCRQPTGALHLDIGAVVVTMCDGIGDCLADGGVGILGDFTPLPVATDLDGRVAGMVADPQDAVAGDGALLSRTIRLLRRAKHLIEEQWLVQGGLPLAVPLDRFQVGPTRQGEKAGSLDWTQGFHQGIQAPLNQFVFREILERFHLKPSLSQ